MLDRLEKDGWITAEKPGSRGSKPFSITKAGAKKLAKEWRDLLRRRPTSIDEILRILYLSRVLGNAPLAVRFATQATADLEALREMKRLEACQYDPGLGSSSRADWYRSLKLRSQAAEAEAQAHLLSDVAGELLGAKRSKKKR
ncbi:hypothetical protein [Candidatus Korobacter versatilis]|uniref:hypothetical protein n=1 Tax=Candidatus Korobacter versatilis TaxID=658062 RepID=UPI0016506718|nr:hypothetical protein [Candidatus Koribacter versatilis]